MARTRCVVSATTSRWYYPARDSIINVTSARLGHRAPCVIRLTEWTHNRRESLENDWSTLTQVLWLRTGRVRFLTAKLRNPAPLSATGKVTEVCSPGDRRQPVSEF